MYRYMLNIYAYYKDKHRALEGLHNKKLSKNIRARFMWRLIAPNFRQHFYEEIV